MPLKIAALFLSASISAHAENGLDTLNSLTHKEGDLITQALGFNPDNVSQLQTQKLFFRAYPEYKFEGNKCRDITISKEEHYSDMTACKIGGDWFMLYNE
jgi:hypothetical protein